MKFPLKCIYRFAYTYTHGSKQKLGTKNISISDEAYSRLATQKRENESFTDVINRITGKRSILELRGLLTKKEAKEMIDDIHEVRRLSRKRLAATIRKMGKASSPS